MVAVAFIVDTYLVQQSPPCPIFYKPNLIYCFHYLLDWSLWALKFATPSLIHIRNRPNNKAKELCNFLHSLYGLFLFSNTLKVFGSINKTNEML